MTTRVVQGPIFGMTYKGRFSPWDLFMLRGSNGKRTAYNKCALGLGFRVKGLGLTLSALCPLGGRHTSPACCCCLLLVVPLCTLLPCWPAWAMGAARTTLARGAEGAMVVCRARPPAAVMSHIQAKAGNGRNSHRVCPPGVQGGAADGGGGFERGGCEEAAVIRDLSPYPPAYQVAADVVTRPAGPVCRAMPLMVVGGLSEEEARALGMHNYDKGYLETATLFGGVDRAGPQGRVAQFLGLTTGSVQELGFGAEGMTLAGLGARVAGMRPQGRVAQCLGLGAGIV